LKKVVDKINKTNENDVMETLLKRVKPNHKTDPSGSRLYMIEGMEFPLPSVSTVLAATEDHHKTSRINAWKQKTLDEHGVDGELMIASHAIRGTRIHELIESYYCGGRTTINPDSTVKPWWDVLQPVLDEFKPELLESALHHPIAYFAGTVDFVGYYQDQLVVLDWKTKSRPQQRKWLGDHAIQLAAYASCLNRLYGLGITTGIVVASSPDAECQIFDFDLIHSFKAWMRRLIWFYQSSQLEARSSALSSLRTHYSQFF
jgi:hypothetical protein